MPARITNRCSMAARWSTCCRKRVSRAPEVSAFGSSRIAEIAEIELESRRCESLYVEGARKARRLVRAVVESAGARFGVFSSHSGVRPRIDLPRKAGDRYYRGCAND